VNKEIYTVKIGNKKITIIHGDITEENVDAIVNAANSYLKHGGGVAGAILKKGGKVIQEESNRINFVPVGKAAITSAGNLPSKYVIHSVGPRWGEGNEENKLRSAIISALKIATAEKVKSLSIPAISTGIFGFPKDKGTKIIFETIKNFLKNENTSLEVVRICNIDKETTEFFLNLAKET